MNKSQENIFYKIWLYKQLEDGLTIDNLLQPVLHTICKATTSTFVLATKLVELGGLEGNEMDECTNQTLTPFEKNAKLYRIIMKKDAGHKLIEALEISNGHIFKLVYDGHKKVTSTNPSKFQETDSLPPKIERPRSSYEPEKPNNWMELIRRRRFTSAEIRRESQSDCDSLVHDRSNLTLSSIVGGSSNRTSCSEIDTAKHEVLRFVGLDKNENQKDLKKIIPIYVDDPYSKKKVILIGYTMKIKTLLEFLKPFQTTLEHLELNNVTIIPRKRPKIIQKEGQLKLLKLKTFILNLTDKNNIMEIKLGMILSSILNLKNADLTKSPSLWSCNCDLIDIKRNGQTMLALKKFDDEQQLILRDFSFLDCRPFLNDIGTQYKNNSESLNSFKLSCLALRLPLNLIPPSVRELNLNNCTLELIEDRGFMEIFETFDNLTSLIIACHCNPTKGFNLNINILLLDYLQVLILRNVTLTGDLDEELINKIKSKELIIFYQCDLTALKMQIKTNQDSPLNENSVIMWRGADLNNIDDDLIWNVETNYDEAKYFDLFRCSHFYKRKQS